MSAAEEPAWSDAYTDLYQGDVLAVLQQLPSRSVQCVVTSPPYWALRSYGVAGQVGLEALHDCLGWATGTKCGDCYVCHMTAVFSEVRRVLRDDGCCFVNLGDSYAGSGVHAAHHANPGISMSGSREGFTTGETELWSRGWQHAVAGKATGLKQKDMAGIPGRVALALQADGWWLRSDVIWSKPNPMPESVTDRPAKAHEYIFLLTKSERYFYDADAVREPNTEGSLERYKVGERIPEHRKMGGSDRATPAFLEGQVFQGNGRNLRSVWTIATEPNPLAHFATYPQALVEPCVKAGTSEHGCCPVCGAPWVRCVERTPMVIDRSERTHEKGRTRASGTMVSPPSATTTGWRRPCACVTASHEVPAPVPCVVLDIFMGSGTTAVVARRLGRRAIGIELNEEYIAMQVQRCGQGVLL